MAEKVPLVKATTLSPGRIIDSTQSSPAETCATDAVGIDVSGPPELTEHLLGLDHAAEDVLLHVVGQARLCEAFEHSGVGVPGTGTGGKRFRDFKREICRHATS